jgi:antitoxin component YwqK of YwqJK toxin-antitoxin module
MITTKNKFGLLHSVNDKPSLIDDEGNKFWHKDGRLHRDNIDLPYIEMSNGDKYYKLNYEGDYKIINHLHEEWFNKDNEWHKEDGPAVICYDCNGDIISKSYREDGPAEMQYYENRNIKIEIYYKNGDLHREDGPAVIFYYSNGKIKYEQYYLNGKKHRGDGPAHIYYYENGNIKAEYYYLNGLAYYKKDYLEQTKDLKSFNKMT